jgi:hypothetical protein
MDIPQLKDIIQKLSVFKRHSSLFVPAVVALISVLLFIPTKLISSKLGKQMFEESITKRGRYIGSLLQNTPAGDQWKLQQVRQEAYQNDANQISLLAKELTQRQLLSDKIFPEPRDESILLFKEFGQRFRAGVDELQKRIKAGECPTEAELKRSMGGLFSSRRSERSPYRSALNEAGDEIRDALCRAKAESCNIYSNPMDLSGYEFWGDYQYAGTTEAVEDCWYFQSGYWIIEDIIDTIEAMNSGSNSVFTSPVKRLLGVIFSSSQATTLTSRERTTGDRPHYILTTLDGLTIPCTARICNNDIDVVHFNVRVAVGKNAVLQFMQRLCSAKQHIIRELNGQTQEPRYAKHNQITILEHRISSIDRRDKTHSLYRYGEDAVVELDLICEYIFSKKGYDEIKPASVKKSQIIETALPGLDPRRRR